MDHRPACHGSFIAIPSLDMVDVEKAYGTVHHIITVFNDTVDHKDGVMQAVAQTQTQWNE